MCVVQVKKISGHSLNTGVPWSKSELGCSIGRCSIGIIVMMKPDTRTPRILHVGYCIMFCLSKHLCHFQINILHYPWLLMLTFYNIGGSHSTSYKSSFWPHCTLLHLQPYHSSDLQVNLTSEDSGKPSLPLEAARCKESNSSIEWQFNFLRVQVNMPSPIAYYV